MAVITDNTATLANALARIAELEAELKSATLRNPDSALCIGVNDEGKPWFSIGHQKFTLDFDPAEQDQESARWYVRQLSAAFERLTDAYIEQQPDSAPKMVASAHRGFDFVVLMDNGEVIALKDDSDSAMPSTPTPPSAEQDEKSEAGKAMNWDYYQELLKQNGFCGITDLLTKYHALERSVEQPDSAAPVKIKQPMVLVGRAQLNLVLNALYRDAEEGRSIRKEIADEISASCIEQPPIKPQRITEQDLLEIFLNLWKAQETDFQFWLESEGRTLLAKLNENSEPDYKAQRDLLLAEMKKLACLGNGETYGNSKGNCIAIAAIAQCEGQGDV